MIKKKGKVILLTILVIFFGSIFYRSITTYDSIKSHTGYTFGTIVKVWNYKGGWYSWYQYTVHGIVFQGRQGEKHNLQDIVLIVYDTTTPRFSMIAKYPSLLLLNSKSELTRLDTSIVSYDWWHYLPGDEIHSIKDLWSIE